MRNLFILILITASFKGYCQRPTRAFCNQIFKDFKDSISFHYGANEVEKPYVNALWGSKFYYETSGFAEDSIPKMVGNTTLIYHDDRNDRDFNEDVKNGVVKYLTQLISFPIGKGLIRVKFTPYFIENNNIKADDKLNIALSDWYFLDYMYDAGGDKWVCVNYESHGI